MSSGFEIGSAAPWLLAAACLRPDVSSRLRNRVVTQHATDPQRLNSAPLLEKAVPADQASPDELTAMLKAWGAAE